MSLTTLLDSDKYTTYFVVLTSDSGLELYCAQVCYYEHTRTWMVRETYSLREETVIR